ncbi:MAG: VWA domain-containing protein [Verrucomicrobia bacterium]|nr:VWA domain-containing protein [Verrucomicrobiota bacterium]
MSEMGLRRLAIYFVLDWSASMRGPLRETVLKTLRSLHDHIRSQVHQDTENQKPLALTFIVYQTQAFQLMPLTPVREGNADHTDVIHHLAEIETGGASLLSAALIVLERSIQNELESPGLREGDATPLVFLVTDGRPSDGHNDLSRSFCALGKHAIFCVVFAGPDQQQEELWREQILRERLRLFPNHTHLYQATELAGMQRLISNEIQLLAGNQRYIVRPRGYLSEMGLVAF